MENDNNEDNLGQSEDNLFVANLSAGQDEVFEPVEILRIAFGNAVAKVTDNGEIDVINYTKSATSYIVRDAGEAIRRNFNIEVHEDSSVLPVVFETDTMRLPAGAGVVVGPASVGKTPVLKWLVAASNAQNAGSAKFLRFGEPLPGYLTRESDAVHALTSYLLDPDVKVIAIDSIKDLLASMGGGLMARGIPRELFRMLSQWGAIASSLGKLIIVPLNISTDNEDALAEVEAAVLSNATFAAIANNGTSVGSTFSFATTARLGEGKRREIGKWELRFESDGTPTITTNGKAAKQEDSKPIVPSAFVLSNSVANRALAQALSRNKDQE